MVYGVIYHEAKRTLSRMFHVHDLQLKLHWVRFRGGAPGLKYLFPTSEHSSPITGPFLTASPSSGRSRAFTARGL